MKKLIQLSIEDVCDEYNMLPETILKYVAHEWISPFDNESMLFDDEDLARIALIGELQENLSVNDDSVIIILNLIDQINCLRASLDIHRKQK